MTRLIVIGIDGMDADFCEEWFDRLPNLRMIYEKGGYRRSRSVFPPDSIPAWVTIFTGVHPALHGWMDNMDYEDIKRGGSAYDINYLRGKTFWDIASAENRRVCVINPLLAYPVWPVNGIMINGPVFITGSMQSYPESILNEIQCPELGGMTDFPSEDELDGFVNKIFEHTQKLFECSFDLYKREKWDLFFVSFFTLDRIQHFLWRYYDKHDPTHPGDTNLQDAIPDLYMLIDKMVGKFLEMIGNDEETILMVLSDHGHGMRPTSTVNINEILRVNGLLQTANQKNIFNWSRLVELLKNKTLSLLSQLGLENISYVIAKLFPKKIRRTLKKSTYLIDKVSSDTWASEMGGGSSFGGIEVNQMKYKPNTPDYQKLILMIKSALLEQNSKTAQPVVKWVESADEYTQNKKGYYPDILFELSDKFSVGASLFSGSINVNPRHKRVSGGHKPEGVFFLTPKDKIGFELPGKLSLLEIYPLVLRLLKISL